MRFLFRLIVLIYSSPRADLARVVSAYFKIHGFRLERRWPYLIKSDIGSLNLYIEDLILLESCANKKMCIMNIGAYDGIENDPISHFVRTQECDAIFLEPQKKAFTNLVKNYQQYPHFLLINKALDDVSGQRNLYVVDENLKSMPHWFNQIASFDKKHVKKHEEFAPGLNDSISKERVDTISFEDLLSNYEIKRVDIIQVDAEGMDDKIIRWIPFSRIKPGLLIYEVAHMSQSMQSETCDYLIEHGYKIFPMNSGMDAAAVLTR